MSLNEPAALAACGDRQCNRLPAAQGVWPGVAALLVAIAMGITTLALAINGQTGWRFGATPLASVTFAGPPPPDAPAQ